MLLAIFCVSIAILLSVGVYMLFSVKEDKKKQILTELGLTHGIASPLKSPFYKWGWRKVSDDRVWGERIVREAFDKHNIALSQQDLEYFSQACNAYSSGGTVEKTAIIGYVGKILARSSSVSNFAVGFIAPILQRSLNASPSQAQKLLEREKVQSAPSNAPDRLAIRQITKMLKLHGMKIIGPNSPGFQVKSESGDVLMTLQGFDSWEFWLKSCADGVEQCITDRSIVKNNTQAKFLRNQLCNGTISNYSKQLKKSRHFIKTLEKLCSQESISKSKTDIENLERIFYSWHFSEGIKFSLQNQAALQDLIVMPEFPSRFRQAILEFITPVYESLQALAHRFPRHVIFFGSNPETRSYAAQQYIVHYTKLSKTVSDIINKKTRNPLFLRIFETDIDKARNPDPTEYISAAFTQPNDEDDNVVSGNTGHLPVMLDAQKRMTLFERNMDINTAEKAGWIIELPVEDLTPKEYAQLDLGEYIKYKRVNCDKYGSAGQGEEGKSAQFKREKFLNDIFNDLLSETMFSAMIPNSEGGEEY